MSRPKVLVTREVFDDTLELLCQHFDVTANQADKLHTPAELAAALADKDGVLTALTDRVDDALLAHCPRLKAVCNMAVGYNNIDVAACSKRSVMASNTPGVLEETTADFAFALMLATARRLSEAEDWLRAGQWQGWGLKQFLGVDVHGATLGIVGMGRIGQEVAKRARGFGMTTLYYNRKPLDSVLEQQCHASYTPLDELLARADIVTLHVPYSAETHHLIGDQVLAHMKRTALLINTARGGVVDDAALIRALREGRLGGAGLDVFEDEPKFNPAFLELKNVTLTPHIASCTEVTRRKMALTGARNLVAALTTGKPLHWLNPWT